MRKIAAVIFIITLIIMCLVYYLAFKHNKYFLNPLGKQSIPKPLLAYTFVNLKKTTFPVTQITLGEKVSQTENAISQMFYFSVPQSPQNRIMEKVSGLINIPKAPGNYPIIVMFRGFVPLEIYKSGIGTQPVASAFAQNGFITVAPDFLGYGQSASASANGFEDRFQTYVTALTLLSSLKTINTSLSASYSATTADITKIGIWGHSNGGHIALATLAISGAVYPTVLWAPVSKSFPYSILYYTDETDDQGKALRKALAHFEQVYNTDDFSPSRFYSWIKGPIEIHQGDADQEVPIWWSDNLVTTLKKYANVTYYTYPGADHNMLPNAWSQAVSNSILFYTHQFSSHH